MKNYPIFWLENKLSGSKGSLKIFIHLLINIIFRSLLYLFVKIMSHVHSYINSFQLTKEKVIFFIYLI